MHRLFVALRPPPPIRDALLALAGGVPGARWQVDEQLHLTLRFVGVVERPLAEDLAAALAGVSAPVPEVRLAGVGSFDETLWAGVTPGDALAALHRKVDAACVRAGLPPERRAYKPHITLARLSRRAALAPEVGHWIADHAALASAPFPCPHLILFESHLGGEGARYEPVARWPLG